MFTPGSEGALPSTMCKLQGTHVTLSEEAAKIGRVNYMFFSALFSTLISIIYTVTISIMNKLTWFRWCVVRVGVMG